MIAVVPVRAGELPAGGAETVAECGGRVLLIGSGADQALAALEGVATQVVSVEAGDFRPGAWAGVLAPLLADEPAVVLPASPDGRDLAPRLAAHLQRPLLAGAMQVTPERVELSRNGGRELHRVTPGPTFVATLQPGVRGQIPDPAGPQPVVRRVDLQSDSLRTGLDADVAGVLPPDPATVDLSEAPRIVGGGAGLDSPERLEQLARIGVALGASMGATRVVTDRGWAPHARQIGTTGVVVDPDLYLAFGISGAVQHTSGLGHPQHIIAVNTDGHCPMMQLADLAITADANATLDELQRLLA